jgi:hypothetical protein
MGIPQARHTRELACFLPEEPQPELHGRQFQVPPRAARKARSEKLIAVHDSGSRDRYDLVSVAAVSFILQQKA